MNLRRPTNVALDFKSSWLEKFHNKILECRLSIYREGHKHRGTNIEQLTTDADAPEKVKLYERFFQLFHTPRTVELRDHEI